MQALLKADQLTGGGDGYDCFFLAMAHWRAGDKNQARAWYDKGAAWTAKNRPRDTKLNRYRGKAAELLGIQQPPPTKDTPAPKP